MVNKNPIFHDLRAEIVPRRSIADRGELEVGQTVVVDLNTTKLAYRPCHHEYVEAGGTAWSLARHGMEVVP